MNRAVIAALIFLLSAPVFSAASGAEKLKNFTGIVISLDQERVEVKRGKTEKTFLLTAETKLVSKTIKSDHLKLALCQKVRVYFTQKASALQAESITIIKKGYCGK